MSFIIEARVLQGQPVEKPLYVHRVRNQDRRARPYWGGTDWSLTAVAAQAQSFAKATTAAKWAKQITYEGSQVFEVVPAHERTS